MRWNMCVCFLAIQTEVVYIYQYMLLNAPDRASKVYFSHGSAPAVCEQAILYDLAHFV
jgi:hypothetical protein